VAQYDFGSAWAPQYGHVAYVQEVGAGYIVVGEDNYPSGPLDVRRINAGGSDWPSNFIHFKDLSPAPAAAPTPPPAPVVHSGGLSRFYNGADHYTAVGTAPAGYHLEGTFGQLLSTPAAGTVALNSCNFNGDEFTSTDPGCEGKTKIGLLGYAYTAAPASSPSRGLYRCVDDTKGEHFDSPDPGCDGKRTELQLGYMIG